jgi:predicted flap endonuclease-1-like 5' DNA nuclease
LAGLRLRLSEVEAARAQELDGLAAQLAQARADVASAMEEARAATTRAAAQVSEAVPPRAAKVPRGLRRIRGIGPAYQRVLEQLGVTRVEQVAAWSEQDIVAFADKLKIRPDRVTKDDWVGQAKRLEPDCS